MQWIQNTNSLAILTLLQQYRACGIVVREKNIKSCQVSCKKVHNALCIEFEHSMHFSATKTKDISQNIKM